MSKYLPPYGPLYSKAKGLIPMASIAGGKFHTNSGRTTPSYRADGFSG